MNPELLWDELLSEDAARVGRAWNELTDDECEAVLAHLRCMASEPDWQAAQKQAAEAALRLIQELANRF